MKISDSFLPGFALLAILGLSALPARADSNADATVRRFYTQLTSVMKQGEQLGYNGRYEKLTPLIEATFNLPEMARLTVGSSWMLANAQEQQQLIKSFSDFSVASYASRFTAYHGEQFDITGDKTTDAGTVVETALHPAAGDPVSLSYLVKRDDKGNYRVIDIFVNGTISEIATRRGEFSPIAREDGIPALVHSLDEKSKEMGSS